MSSKILGSFALIIIYAWVITIAYFCIKDCKLKQFLSLYKRPIKRIGLFFVIGIVLMMLFGCASTTQKPSVQAPTYNITITDNSQHIIGDGNTPSLSASTTSDQTAPTIDQTSKATTKLDSSAIIIILISLLIAGGVGIWLYLKNKRK